MLIMILIFWYVIAKNDNDAASISALLMYD
jgi:hypothetical protein